MALLKRLWEVIRDVDRVIVYCAENLENHIPVLSMNIEGFEAMNTGTMLDVDFNVATRTGLHCAPLVHEQIETMPIGGTVRFSVGPFNNEEDIDTAIQGVKEIVKLSGLWKVKKNTKYQGA